MNRIAITFLLCCVFVAGCGYGEVSPKSYEIAKSLYNISNRKLSDQLDKVKGHINQATENEEISSTEAKWLRAIAQKAERGDWKRAMQDARRMMEDQIDK